MTKRYPVHIDYFGSDLGDIPKSKRFSAFEMNGKLHATLKRLESAGHFKLDSESVGYPWTMIVFPPDQTP